MKCTNEGCGAEYQSDRKGAHFINPAHARICRNAGYFSKGHDVQCPYMRENAEADLRRDRPNDKALSNTVLIVPAEVVEQLGPLLMSASDNLVAADGPVVGVGGRAYWWAAIGHAAIDILQSGSLRAATAVAASKRKVG